MTADNHEIVCFAHVRWERTHARERAILRSSARRHRVFFVEPPIHDSPVPALDVRRVAAGVHVAVPHVPPQSVTPRGADGARKLIDDLFDLHGIQAPVLWYCDSAARAYTRHVPARLVVFDAATSASSRGAGADALRREADVVFDAHAPDIDVTRGQLARVAACDPPDQAAIPRPRAGMLAAPDIDPHLVDAVARRMPSWHFVIVGASAADAAAPRRPNICWLEKPQADRPAYVAGWDVAIVPSREGAEVRTRILDYLAAGVPVVATATREAISPFGEDGLIRIADDAGLFAGAIEASTHANRIPWPQRVDAFLARRRPDRSWRDVAANIEALLAESPAVAALPVEASIA